MIRKNLLSFPVLMAAGIMIAGFHGCSPAGQGGKPGARQNILFIMSDDHAFQAISAYRYHLVQTPGIDRIAREGTLFTNASATNSICAPSRAVILTGMHSHLNGKIDNRMPFIFFAVFQYYNLHTSNVLFITLFDTI